MKNAKLKIRKYPDQILKKKCEEVKEVNEEIKKLIFYMIDTMKKSDGVGISAPQVGISQRIIIVTTENGPKGFINPKIMEKSKITEVGQEGCLSLPGIFLNIKRAKEVKIEAVEDSGKKIYLKAQGLIARIFQHEIDHLDGVLFVGRADFWQRLKIKNKLKNLENQFSKS